MMFINQLQRQIKDHAMDWTGIYNQLMTDEQGKKDIVTDTLCMESDGTLTIDGVKGYRIPREVEGAVLSRIVPSGTTYLRRCDTHLRAYNVNHWLWQRLGKTFFIRTKETSRGKIVRAVLTDRYTRMDNLPIYAMVYEQFHQNFIPVDLAITDTSFHLRLAHKEGMDVSMSQVQDIVHTGFHVSNSETGNGSVKLYVITYRLVCKNGMVSPQQLTTATRSHTGKDIEMFHFFQQAMTEGYTSSHQLLAMLKQSQSDRFDRSQANALVEYLGRKNNWKSPFIEAVQEFFFLQSASRFGLIQAITEASKLETPDERLRLEKQAGDLLPMQVTMSHLAQLALAEQSLN